ncbi:MAG: hypothetical protein V4537_17140 [Pseudomonadota bacterium]
MLALIVLALVLVLAWLAIDFLRDAFLFLTPEETAKRRLHRRVGSGDAYDRAVSRIDSHKPWSTLMLSIAGLTGMLVTAWIILG